MMAGKGSAWRQGTVRKQFAENDDFWAQAEKKKESVCSKCNSSWECSNAYVENICIGLVKKKIKST